MSDRASEGPATLAGEELVTSVAAAARHLGNSSTRVGQWRLEEELGELPWTVAALEAAAAPRLAVDPGNRGARSEHGTASRWRYGCPCRACADAHNAELREYRSGRKAAALALIEDDLIAELARGGTYQDVLTRFGVIPQTLNGHRQRDQRFARRLDAALMAGRDPEIPHGTNNGWRARCRCPECREIHSSYGHRTARAPQLDDTSTASQEL